MASSMYNDPSTFNYGRYEKSCPYRASECTRTECPDGFRNREETRMNEFNRREGWYPGNFGSRDFFRYAYETCPWMFNRFDNRYHGFDNFYRHMNESCPWMNNREMTPWGHYNYESFPWHHYYLEMCPWFNKNDFNNFNNRNWSNNMDRNWMERFNGNRNNWDMENWFRNWNTNNFFGNFKNFERELERDIGQFRNFFDKWWNTDSKNYSTTLAQAPSRPASNLEYYTFMNPVKVDGYGNRWLYICFDLRSFKPEEVRCTFYTKATPAPYIEVEANHHVKDSKEHDVKRTYERKYFFPKDLYYGDATKLELKSYMTNEGYFYCEAKLPQLKPEEARVARPHMPVNVCPIKTEVKDM